MAELGGRSSSGEAYRDHSSIGSKQPFSSSSKSSGKTPQTHLLMFVLSMGQVAVIMLYLVLTIKACFIRYNRVFTVAPIDPIPDPHHPPTIASNQDDITSHHHHHLHINQSNIKARQPDKSIQLDWQGIAVTNESRQVPNTEVAKRKLRIVGTTDTQLLQFTFNWLESLKRLKLDYDVTLIAEDESAYQIMTRRIRNSSDMKNTRVIAGMRSEGIRAASLSLVDISLDVLETGTDVVLISVDAVWLKDPVAFIWQKYDQCDVWISSGSINIPQSLSFMLLKSSPKVISSLKEHLTNSTGGVLTSAMMMSLTAKRLHFNVTFCNLGENKFPSEQHVFEEEGWFNVHKEDIYVVRTCAIVDMAKKRYSLKTINLWYI